MNKLSLLSCIKGLIFVLKSSTELILSTAKKVSKLSFCSRLKVDILVVSTLTFAFKAVSRN